MRTAQRVVIGLSLLACAPHCGRPEEHLAGRRDAAPLAPLPSASPQDGLDAAPPDVRRFVRAAFALRDSARHGNRETLGNHPEVPWLGDHVAWDLLAALA